MPALARSAPPELHAIHADIWHAHTLGQASQPVRATGDAALDAQLPGGGWPVGALTEILQPPGVHCEWRLLLPALARCGPDPVLLVAPPHIPFAPALAAQGLAAQRLLWVKAGAAQALWACEQALRCADIGAVLAWLPQVRSEQLRRLQMAAAEHSKLLFVMRSTASRDEASPAALRLQLQPQAQAQAQAQAQNPSRTQGLAMPAAGGAAAQAEWAAASSTTTTATATATVAGAGAGAGAGVVTAVTDALQVHLLKRRGPPLARPLSLPARPARLNLLLAACHALDRTSACA